MGTSKKIGLSTVLAVVFGVAAVACGAVYAAQKQAWEAETQSLRAQNGQLVQQAAEQENNRKALEKEQGAMLREKADRVLLALKGKDGAALRGFVHPLKGLRFSPYSSIDLQKDVRIPAADIPGLFDNVKSRNWGAFDGSGEPIQMTFRKYYAKFVYDKNFLEAPQIDYNQAVQRGNSINNQRDVYPQGITVGYYFPGFDTQYQGMDWESLLLVFEPSGTDWYLVGIVHGQWTI